MTAAPLVAAGPGVSHHVAVVISGKVAGGAGVADAADITCTGAAANTNALAWEEVGCHVPARRRKGQEVTLMQGVCGVARSGDLVAIIGPSGAGKSTLLDILAQRKTVGRLEGRITYRGHPLTSAGKMHRSSSYVLQEDSFHPTVTVLEAVLFQAHMRLSIDVPLATKMQRVHEVVGLVGLQGKGDDRVGGQLPGGIMIRGLSGGEKRRLSLCCGIVAGPEVLFCDEPTSGLDSLAALKITQVLHSFATGSSMAVVCTIHQPRQSMWELFSHVMVLAKGRQLFFGSPEEAHAWFTTGLGLKLPPGVPTAEFIIDMANIDFDKSSLYGNEDEAKCEAAAGDVETRGLRTAEDLEKAAAAFREQRGHLFKTVVLKESPDGASTTKAVLGPHPSLLAFTDSLCAWGFKFRVLLERNFRIYMRNPGNVLARFLVYTSVAIAAGVLCYDIGKETGPRAASDFMGCIFFLLLGACVLPYASISLFLYDRQFYQGENASGLYPPSAYFAANILLEMLLTAAIGIVYSVICYYMVSYWAFIHPANPPAMVAGYVGIFVAMNMVSNAQVLFCALASPNVEIAFILCAAYTNVALLLSGTLISFPAINRYVSIVQYASSIKYGFAAMMLHFFKGNAHAVTPFGTMEEMLHAIQIDSPATAWGNVLGMGGLYVVFMVGAFLCLKFLYREVR